MPTPQDAIHVALAARGASEAKYRVLADTIQEGLFMAEAVLDGQGEPVDWRYLEANPAYARMLGREPGSIMGRTVLDLYPTLEQHWLAAYREAAYGIRPIKLEGLLPSNGRWYEHSLVSHRRGQFACLMLDITDRRWAEMNHRTREDLFEGVFQKAPLAMAITDAAQGRFLAINRTFTELFGYTFEEVRGRTATDLGIWADPEDRTRALAGVMTEGSTCTLAVKVIRKDGTPAWVTYSARAIDLDGQLALLSTAVDSTEQHLLLGERETRSRLLDRFMERTPVAFAMVDRELRYLFASRRWFAAFGWSPEDWVGRNLLEVYPLETEPWREVARQGLAGATLKDVSLAGLGAEGDPVRMALEVCPWEESPGVIGGLILTAERSRL